MAETRKPKVENTLSDAERWELVLGVDGMCRKAAITAAERFNRPADDVDDLAQQATLAAHQAARFWSPDHGTKFSTFAHVFIKKSLFRELVAEFDRRDGRDPYPLMVGDGYEPASRDLSPLDQLIAKKEMEAAGSLTPDDLAPLERLFRELQFEDTLSRLDIPTKA
jgi:hypothetical protein